MAVKYGVMRTPTYLFRNILGVRTTTLKFMTYGELGRTPIDTVESHCLEFG